jgi:hypothetical protein
MPNAVLFITYNLAEGASVPDFLLASEKLNDGYMSKQQGYISWKQLLEDGVWADLLTWETMDDAKRALDPNITNPLSDAFYSFLDPESCVVHLFSVERSYE